MGYILVIEKILELPVLGAVMAGRKSRQDGHVHERTGQTGTHRFQFLCDGDQGQNENRSSLNFRRV